jgi:tetratricopeptide (TPR) repeat protein
MTGYLYASTGNDDLALAYEYQALRTTRATRELLSIQGALYAIGSIYKKTGRIDSARVYFRQALELADEVGNRDIENEICKNLSDVYRQQDSLKLSHHYLLRCQELKDDLLTPQKIHRINTIDFSDSKKENGVSAVWWILSLSILLLLPFAWFHFRGKPKNGPSETDLRKHDELEARISNQQKELMTQTIRLQQQGELIERTKSELTGLDLNEQSRLKVRTLLSELKSTQQSSNWSEFETHFNDVHLDFYKRLMIDYPQLTVNERRLCGFISLNLTNKEISEITRKSIRSIEVAKYRLSRKLEIPKEGSLKKKLTGYL